MRIGLIAALAACTAGVAAQDTSAVAVAIVNVSVLPMDTDRLLSGQTVIVERGRITRIGRSQDVPVPAGARRINGAGKYLLPGIADVHVHLASNPPDEQRMILKLLLTQGVTTVLNMRGSSQLLQLRADVAAGRVVGPRIFTVGPYVNEPFVTTPEQVEQAVVEQRRAGYDFVKLHGDLSREAYSRLIAVARREGIRVIGHAPRNLGIEALFEERQYALAHAEEFLYDRLNRSTDSSLPYVEARVPEFARETARAGVWVMPNLTAYRNIALMVNDLGAMLDRPEMRYLPASVRTGWGPATNPYTARIDRSRYQPMMRRYAILEKLVRELRASGVRLLLGTDAMNTGTVPGYSAHDELEALVAAGLSPYEALRAATANAAAFLAVPDGRGVVAVGQRADLLLLDRNPLQSIANSRAIAGVVLNGRWFGAGDLAVMLDELALPSR